MKAASIRLKGNQKQNTFVSENMKHSSTHPSTGITLTNWEAVLNFLLGLQPKEKGEVHLKKKAGEAWTAQTDLSEKPIKLTARWRGVGLFDLNW